MSRVPRPVPDAPTRAGAPAFLQPVGDPPAAAELDELGRARIRRLLAGYLGEFPTLDAHVALLDTRGAWYAERVLGAWTTEQPDTFFGLVRHVVRTQLPGPPPAPDIEGWLAAGRPDGAIGAIWDRVRAARYPRARQQPAATRVQPAEPTVGHMDDLLDRWPGDRLDAFTLAYCSLEVVLEMRQMTLPRFDV